MWVCPTFGAMDINDVFKAAGGVTKLARGLGLHHTTVLGWTAVPPKHVRAVTALTGIPAHELRSDLWDAPGAESAESQAKSADAAA
jgi:DNA-binding transcriptional regulator YdaS (Cro superfamily)